LKKFLFVDLDDTLFQTLRKLPIDNIAHDTLSIGSTYQDGSPCSWLTQKQQAWWQWLNHDSIVIPVTARTLDAFKRVSLKFSQHAIVNFGAHVFQPDGALDQSWQKSMQAKLSPHETTLQTLFEQLKHYASTTAPSLRIDYVYSQCDENFPLYVLLKDKEKNIQTITQAYDCLISPWLATHQDYYIHQNDNNLAIMPRQLNKAYAVNYLIEILKQTHSDIITCGMGDSKTDLNFMKCCDYWLTPSNSQLSTHISF
jgi:hydroxymethylpyrimidine pyrophosphatase-like HAD family hydrolase